MNKSLLYAVFFGLTASPAFADSTIPVGNGVTLLPSYDARLRYESVDQENGLENADALTVRVRAGLEIGLSENFAILGEVEGTLAPIQDYNSTTNGKTDFSTIADPQNVELNRLHLLYRGVEGSIVTVGRQRINLDDQRFVGSVGWRQNEQTFDAARLESTFGPAQVDATYAWSNRTSYGIDAGPRQAFSGDNFFLTTGVKTGPALIKAFAFLIDQDEPGRSQFSSQTYGLRATAAFPLGPDAKLSLAASYAIQSDYKSSAVDYRADYYMADATLDWQTFSLNGNYEVLGSDAGVFAFQTPLATLHKFQGWADLFLTTPSAGVRDLNFTLTKKFPAIPVLPALSATIAYHKFDSDIGDLDYGQEWDAQVGFKLLETAVLLKYADFDSGGFGADTRKFWVQLGWIY